MRKWVNYIKIYKYMRIYKPINSHPSITSLTELLGRKGDDQGHSRRKMFMVLRLKPGTE